MGLRVSTNVETKTSANLKHEIDARLAGSNADKHRIPIPANLPRRRVEADEEADEEAEDDFYEETDDDDDFEGSWVEKIYTQDDDQIYHYTAGTAKNMFQESPNEWNGWEWVFFVLLLEYMASV